MPAWSGFPPMTATFRVNGQKNISVVCYTCALVISNFALEGVRA